MRAKAKRMMTTSKNGPPIEDIQSRRVWSLTKGKLIDECDVERTPDRILNRELESPDDIRVELVLKGAQKLYERKGPDIAEVYSQPRICNEAAGQLFQGIALKPGWSLDLTMKNPETDEPWDLAE